MDIFKPFLGQGKVSVRYRDGVVARVEILPTLLGSGYERLLPYTVTPPRLIDGVRKGDLFSLYAANGNCYYRGNADIVSIQPVNDVEQNMSYNYKAVLIGSGDGAWPCSARRNRTTTLSP
jgi:hypothetical protein